MKQFSKYSLILFIVSVLNGFGIPIIAQIKKYPSIFNLIDKYPIDITNRIDTIKSPDGLDYLSKNTESYRGDSILIYLLPSSWRHVFNPDGSIGYINPKVIYKAPKYNILIFSTGHWQLHNSGGIASNADDYLSTLTFDNKVISTINIDSRWIDRALVQFKFTSDTTLIVDGIIFDESRDSSLINSRKYTPVTHYTFYYKIEHDGFIRLESQVFNKTFALFKEEDAWTKAKLLED